MTKKLDHLYLDEKACEEIEKAIKAMGNKLLVIGKCTSIGNTKIETVETSTLSDEPEIYADNEGDREVLRSCYYE